jgi:hypothetical protein
MIRLQNKYRTFPRSYDLSQIESYLRVLHQCSLPLIEIEKRKINAARKDGKITEALQEEILNWKKEHGISSADETEYRFLLRDLTLVMERESDPDVDFLMPLGGDGLTLGSFLKSSKFKVHFLTKLGESLLQQSVSERSAYEESLFWLILRNKYYLPLIQEIISNPESYEKGDLRKLIVTEDSVSRNCALQWLRFFGVVNSIKRRPPKYGQGVMTQNRLESTILARYLLAAAILEINNSFVKDTDYYVYEIQANLNETFSLNPTATNFGWALEIIFRAAGKEVVSGFTSGRSDPALPNHPNVSILRFQRDIPRSVAKFGNYADVLKIIPFSSV